MSISSIYLKNVLFFLVLSTYVLGQSQQNIYDIISSDMRNWELENLLKGSLSSNAEVFSSSLLCQAAYSGAYKNVETLVKSKANVNYTDKKGNTPLMYAFMAYFDYPTSIPYRENLISIITCLYSTGAKVDQLNNQLTGKQYPHFSQTKKNLSLPAFLNGIDEEKKEMIAGFSQALMEASTGTVPKSSVFGGLQSSGGTSTEFKFLPFIYFARNWDEPIINTLIKIGADPLVKDNDGTTAFRLLILNKRVPQIKMIYHNNPGLVVSNFCDLIFFDMNDVAAKIVDSVKHLDMCSSPNGLDPAASLLIKNNTELFYKLVKKIDPKRKDNNGKTLLHIAAQYGRLEEVKYLINIGINPDEKDNFQATPFFYSAGPSGNIETVKYLFSLKPDINIQPTGSLTPLMYSIYNFSSVETILFLIEKGADVNLKDKNGITALHLAAYVALPHIYEELIKAGADINARDHRSRTPLHYAASGIKKIPPLLDNVRLLVNNGADIKAKDDRGLTPAALSRYLLGNNGIVKYLNSLK